ncbi:hypothetical protein ACSBR2_020577 [Camellia fascicularis]
MAVCNSCNPTLRSHTFLCSFFFFYFVITLYYFTLHANALSFNLTNVNQKLENVTIIGDAIFSNDGIQITPNEVWKVGRATYKDEFHLRDKASGTLTDFNTSFLFAIDSEGSSNFADGFTFFLISHDSPSSLTRAGYLGLPKEPPSQNQFVAVEFDTYPNEWNPPETHVGININSLTSSATATWYNNITYGKDNKAWISYDSSSKNLSVVFTGYTTKTSVKSVLSYPIDLRNYLPEWVTIGFSAGTGIYSEKHIIKSWSFNSSPNLSPSLRNKKPLVVGLTVGSFGLVCGLALFVFVLWMKRTGEEVAFNMSVDNDFEVGTGPKKFSHGELLRATNKFADILGRGGFGEVYRGFLKESNSNVVVKRISKGSKQGRKEYASEVKIISRLRHKNLVQLLGWCHEKRELLLIYDFMENRSLDYHLFEEKSLLTWAMRYKIAQDLASALLYLHKEWEQCVLHRDIKSNNVMLDSNFNAKLGDFGLARLVDHDKALHTTGFARTMGYVAPEYLVTHKASKGSDIYSFGIVLLEIACGRKSIDSKVPESQMILVQWVWDLYGTSRFLEAADPKIRTEFVQEQMERLMIVGLWCTHPNHNLRPSIRQAIQVLNFEAPLPNLPTEMPVPTFVTPMVNTSSSLVSCTHGSITFSNSGRL